MTLGAPLEMTIFPWRLEGDAFQQLAPTALGNNYALLPIHPRLNDNLESGNSRPQNGSGHLSH